MRGPCIAFVALVACGGSSPTSAGTQTCGDRGPLEFGPAALPPQHGSSIPGNPIRLVPVAPPADPALRIGCRPSTLPPFPGTAGSVSTLAVCTGDLCWETYPSGARIFLVASGAGGAFAVDPSANVLVRREAGEWSPMCPPPDTPGVGWTGIAANGPDDVWIVGSLLGHPAIYRWDGQQWLRPDVTPAIGRPVISGGDGSDIFITDVLAKPTETSRGGAGLTMYRWDGTALMSETIGEVPADASILWLSARRQEAWVSVMSSGTTSRVFHRTASGWLPVALPADVDHVGRVAADPAGGAFVGAVDPHGRNDARTRLLLRCDGDSCRTVYASAGPWVGLLGAANGRALFSQGDVGSVTPPALRLFAPSGVSDLPSPGMDLFDVTADGAAYAFNGSRMDRLAGCTWATELSLDEFGTAAVGGGGSEDLLVGGRGLARFDGSSWTMLAPVAGYSHAIQWIAGPEPDDQFILDDPVSGASAILHWDGASLARTDLPPAAVFPAADRSLALATPSGPDSWTVSSRRDGAWTLPTILPVDPAKLPTGVWASPAGEIWAAATSSVFHLHAGVLDEFPIPSGQVHAIVGVDGGAWAYDPVANGGYRNPPMTDGSLLRITSSGVVDSGIRNVQWLAVTPSGDIFAATVRGTWRHRSGDAADAWTRVSAIGAPLWAARDGTVWAAGAPALGWVGLFTYRSSGQR